MTQIANMAIGGCFDTVEVDLIVGGLPYSATVEMPEDEGEDPTLRVAGPMENGGGDELSVEEILRLGIDSMMIVDAAMLYYEAGTP